MLGTVVPKGFSNRVRLVPSTPPCTCFAGAPHVMESVGQSPRYTNA